MAVGVRTSARLSKEVGMVTGGLAAYVDGVRGTLALSDELLSWRGDGGENWSCTVERLGGVRSVVRART